MRKGRALLQLAIGLALLAALLHYTDVRAIGRALRHSNPYWIAAGVTMFLVALLFPCLRLLILFRNTSLRFRWAVRLTFASYTFNQLLPTGLGGDAYRAMRLKSLGKGWVSTVGPLAFERAIGALSLLVPGLLYAWLSDKPAFAWREHPIPPLLQHPKIWIVLGGIAILTIITLVVCTSTGLWRHARRELEHFVAHMSAGAVALIVLLSMAFHACRLLGMEAFLFAIGKTVPLGEVLVVMGLVLFASLVPISIGALGVREGLMVFALGRVGILPVDAMSVALLNRAVSILIACIGALAAGADTSDALRPGEPTNGSLA